MWQIVMRITKGHDGFATDHFVATAAPSRHIEPKMRRRLRLYSRTASWFAVASSPCGTTLAYSKNCHASSRVDLHPSGLHLECVDHRQLIARRSRSTFSSHLAGHFSKMVLCPGCPGSTPISTSHFESVPKCSRVSVKGAMKRFVFTCAFLSPISHLITQKEVICCIFCAEKLPPGSRRGG